MIIWISIRDSIIRLFELGQNLFDASLLYSERAQLLEDLGKRALLNQDSPIEACANDILSELRILDTKIHDIEEELETICLRAQDTDPLDWI